MGLRCKGCGGEEHIKNGFMRGKQRYRCKACGLNFTDTPPRGLPLALKASAVLLYVTGGKTLKAEINELKTKNGKVTAKQVKKALKTNRYILVRMQCIDSLLLGVNCKVPQPRLNSSFSTAWANVDFPEPDSPVNQRITLR